MSQFTDWTNEEFRKQYHGHKPHNPALMKRASPKPKHGYEGEVTDKEVRNNPNDPPSCTLCVLYSPYESFLPYFP